jgi:hypothetical protein
MAPHGRGSERDGCGDRLLLERRIGSVATGDRPNILFFLTDDLSWNLVSHMTNVQAMQKKGITFSHYFVTESLCCPSRSSIFTGKYPHDTWSRTSTFARRSPSSVGRLRSRPRTGIRWWT